MRILLTGSTGFIGRRLRDRLLADGHYVRCVVRESSRHDTRCISVLAEFTQAEPLRWAEHLADVDVVVNAAGIFRERGAASFDAVHTRGPIALFDACVLAGVPRVIQLSALGADADAPTAFLRSKYAADLHLLALPLDATIVQPSLVFGPNGASSRRFLALASLPLLPLPAGGRQPVQPVHIDDLVAAVCVLVVAPPGDWRGRRVAIVGPEPLSLRAYLETLRAALCLPRARTISIPAAWMDAAAALGSHVRNGLFDRAAWTMLQRGSVAAGADLRALLGGSPRAAAAFLEPGVAAPLRIQAQLDWLLPLLRLALALLWIATAVVSLGVYPLTESHALLARAGVPEALRPTMLYGAALLDLGLGIACLLPLRRRHWLWAAQGGLILVYSLIIAVRLPEFWLHPFGPLTKNIPLLALLALLWTLDQRGARGDG